jgi:hypothetical protein
LLRLLAEEEAKLAVLENNQPKKIKAGGLAQVTAILASV